MKIDVTTWPERVFVTGIGTDVGKSYATGWLARTLASAGKSVITQKFIQTGNKEYSEDILVHRDIMGIPMQTVDRLHVTAPVIFSYPASPDLASRLDGKEIDFGVIDKASATLSNEFEYLLIEGAGGIMVPLKGDYLTIDYIRERGLPVVVVTNGQLGSVSDTLLTLSAIEREGLELTAVVYNPYFDKDKVISADTREYLERWISVRFPGTLWLEMPGR